MSITREDSKLMAKLMMTHTERVYQLRGNGDFGYVSDIIKDLGEFIPLRRFAPNITHSEDKVLWSQTYLALKEYNEKLKYITYLSYYIYDELKPMIQRIKMDGLTGIPQIDKILQSKEYQAYMQNKPIELTTNINNPQEIRISAPGTGYANHRKQEFHSQSDILSLYEDVRQTANKDKRAVIHRPYKKRKFIEQHYQDYVGAYQAYEKDFNQLRQLWAWKMNNGGLRMGTSNDDIYQQVILPVDFRLQKMAYGNRVIREMNTIVREFKRQQENLKDTTYSKIHIYL